MTYPDASIHPTALVEPGASIGAGVRIGPFCHVSAQAVIGENVELFSHVSIMGATTIGAGSKVYPQAVLGGPPQNTRHKGGATTLVIGANATIRESVTMHLGSDNSIGRTTVGDNCYFMAYSHVAHDCVVGNNCTFANNATLGGHCVVGDNVVIGGLTAVHQFTRIGSNAFLGGCSGVTGDVIPYGVAKGAMAKLRGLNVVGMRRSGMKKSDLLEIRRAYKMLFDRARPVVENLPMVERAFGALPAVRDWIDFLSVRGKRYLLTPPLDGAVDDDGDDES